MFLLRIKSILTIRLYCTKPNKSKYSSTVLLPQTKFPLRLENQKLVERDTKLTESYKSLYSWQRENLSGPDFVLHDGPPYANGVPHMGHVINKVLKDIIVRSKIMAKQRVHYVPGWDCHGLPIELKAVTDSGKEITPMHIRHKARNFAKQTIAKQRTAFESWGVIGDWHNSYMTFNKDYIKNQMWQFYNLYEKGLIYRDYKPVYWSPSSKTALAEAELEYKTDHISVAATMKLQTSALPDLLKKYKKVFLLIWTTTPWTLPSNQAVCYNSNLSYSLIQQEGADDKLIIANFIGTDPRKLYTNFGEEDVNAEKDKFIIATNLIEAHSKKLNKKFEILETFSGELLESATYIHPLYNNILPMLDASHATDSKGTGLVHTAPAHGLEDYLVSLNNNINIKCLVDESGCFTAEVGHRLEGLEVSKEGSMKVLLLLEDYIVFLEHFEHSYPYDWRTKQPVILRASKQWFIDTNAIKDRAVEHLKNVKIFPKMNSDLYKRNLIGQLKKRPYWCISRQRSWGAPIPVFYEKQTDKPLINRSIIQNLTKQLDTHGPDYWWKLENHEILPENVLKENNLNINKIKKGQDILDIWFDSGISWSNALEGEQVADMYLEGVDQFTGWFQSSLTTSIAIRDKAPYKTIYVHGFALDENGLKMSKSLGNVIDPQEILKGSKSQKPYGIDTLRWWVACHANQDTTTKISKNILQISAEEVQKVRSVMRFALGALNDYQIHEMDYQALNIIDKYLLHVLYNFKKEVDNCILEYQFNKICTSIINLTTNQISALYYTSIKDRLYCDSIDSVPRQSAQFVLYQIFNILIQTLAPIVPHLSEELHSHLPQKSQESIFQENLVKIDERWNNMEVNELMDFILDIKQEVNKFSRNNIGNVVNICVSNEFNKYKYMCNLAEELCDILQVAKVDIKFVEGQEQLFKLQIEKSNNFNCERCRKVTATFEGELCNRCNLIMENVNNKNILKN